MPAPVYTNPVSKLRPFSVMWAPSDFGGGCYLVRDDRTGAIVRSFPDISTDDSLGHWTEYAARLEATERNHKEELEALREETEQRLAAIMTLADTNIEILGGAI